MPRKFASVPYFSDGLVKFGEAFFYEFVRIPVFLAQLFLRDYGKAVNHFFGQQHI